jgi:Putative beta-barrel porin-2, OmpL-like. bbp2
MSFDLTCNRTRAAIPVPARLALVSALALGAALAAPRSAQAEPSCTGADGKPVDPYGTYACLDNYLGDDVATRLYNYYKLEMGQPAAPSDPNAPASRRDGWPATPQTTPPIPFTEWPYGGVTPIGVTRPNSVDSPFMTAIANTDAGQWLAKNNFQLYGWVDAGFNVSSNTLRPGGNAPIAYSYTPNTIQLDQAVLYLDRFPDTVQTDHIDWGMRLSAIYGENYRYTQSYTPFISDQFLKHNDVNGYDFPMIYGELFIPQVADGLMLRLGRYISVPDIEAQLAPNNYMYSHSLSYSYDNYTNEGLQATLAVTKQLMLQLGVNIGTEAYFGHVGQHVNNPDPNPLYPGNTFLKDPGAKPSLTACVRYTWNDGNDTVYPCADGINNGVWGYNNLQWYGLTYYHKFDEHWHVSNEFYELHENGVPNLNNPVAAAAIADGGTPFSPQYMHFNAPDAALCSNATVLRCRATAVGLVSYINYSPDPLNNFSLRPEFYDDEEGQRTGVKATYYEVSLGWQHWLSPQIEFRPEIGYYRSIDAKAFNGDAAAGIAPDKNYTVIGMADAIFHF